MNLLPASSTHFLLLLLFQITHSMPLEEAAVGYDMFAVHDDNSVKVLLRTKFFQEWFDSERASKQ